MNGWCMVLEDRAARRDGDGGVGGRGGGDDGNVNDGDGEEGDTFIDMSK